MTPESRLGRRLRRILVMVPYIIKHPGVTLDELAERFGESRTRVQDDLDLLFMCGLPGYTPAELIDVSLVGDSVFVSMADYFAAPLRLTPAEGLALYAGGAALLETAGMSEADALRRALTKLGRALGTGDGPGVTVKLDPGPARHLDVLKRALADGRRVRLRYYSATRQELTERMVDPWGLVAAVGRLYLVGLDHLSGDERMFRTDRIKDAEIAAEPAAVPPDFDPERYRGAFTGRGGRLVALELAPAAASWFEDYYPVASATTLDDGWRRVEVLSGGDRWAATLLLRLGRSARNVTPPGIVDEARRLAAAIATRHGPGGGRGRT